MNESTNVSSRREFIKTTGRVAAVSALAGMSRPVCPRRGQRNIASGLDRLRRARHRRGQERHDGQKRPSQTGGHGGCFPQQAQRQLRSFERRPRMRLARRCASGAQVHRIRRLPARHGLPEAGRHRDFHYAAGLPLGAFYLRHRERPQRLHGKAADGGRPQFSPNAQAGRGGVGQEPQGGRGLDVPTSAGRWRNWPSAPRTASSARSF